MKHIFILNPAAGKREAETRILPGILTAVKAEEVDYEIHRTINVGDATRYVRERCLSQPEEVLRFYAVGGDGTLNEVVNGAYGFDHAEIAFIPAGTGNDFARVFPNHTYFSDIRRQLLGKARPMDLIRYNGRFCINVLNIGLDCQVVSEVIRLKKNPLLKGAMAYGAGVAAVFVKNKGYRMTISLEDGSCFDGEMTLVAIGNGAFYGGGFKGVPKARPDDGLLDVSIISKVSRLTFARLIGKYRAGTHLDTPRDFIHYAQCRSLTIRSEEGLKICADGEIEEAGELSVSIEPSCIRFSAPQGCE